MHADKVTKGAHIDHVCREGDHECRECDHECREGDHECRERWP